MTRGGSQPGPEAEVGGWLEEVAPLGGLTEVKRYWWLLKKPP